MPRKTDEQPPQTYILRLASMRPRPDAAENAKWAMLCRSVPYPQASMRPRPDAAENFLTGWGTDLFSRPGLQ